jgi:hypothetical protein
LNCDSGAAMLEAKGAARVFLSAAQASPSNGMEIKTEIGIAT